MNVPVRVLTVRLGMVVFLQVLVAAARPRKTVIKVDNRNIMNP